MALPIAGYALAAAGSIASGRDERLRVAPSLFTAIAALLGVAGSVNALLRDQSGSVFGWSITSFARLSYRIDPLAAFFLLIVSLPALAAAIYGIGYLDASHGDGPEHELPARAGADAAVALFVGSMSLVVMSGTVISFLVAWELMSIVSFLLVLGDGEQRQRRSAAMTYVIFTHVATAFVVFALLVLAREANSLDFGVIGAHRSALSSWEASAAFLCALIGFGAKAGVIPLHVWLPKAHPAAPSNVSALMSGAMVKTAMFGFVLTLFRLDGPGPRWWGVVLIVAGAASALLGILYALVDRDIKRILAYSTIEHMGIGLIGLGTAQFLNASGHAEVAALALLATLIHLLNHALFKSLLFMGAGAVQTASGTRDLERLGGLIKSIPRTAALFLVGCVAISSLPPLNGFVGEWLLFQSLLNLGTSVGTTSAAVLATLAAGVLAMTGALAVVCYVRLYGVGFLAEPQTEHARRAHEAPRSMLAGMGFVAALCLVLGVFPDLLFRLVRPVTRELTGAYSRPSLGLSGSFMTDQIRGHYSPAFVVVGLLVVGVIPWALARLTGGPARRRVAPPWVCGVTLEPRMPYSGVAFSKALRIIFQFVLRPYRTLAFRTPDSDYVVQSISYDEGTAPVYDRYAYLPMVRGVYELARRIRPLQNGSIRSYLGYIFITLVVVILIAR